MARRSSSDARLQDRRGHLAARLDNAFMVNRIAATGVENVA
jgi:hypothetical protein